MNNSKGILKKVLLTIVTVFLLLGLIAGVIWALDFTGVINFYKTAQSIPVLGKMVPVPDKEMANKTPLQLENEKIREENEGLQKNINQLNKKINDLQHELDLSKVENQKLQDERSSLQETISSLQTWKDEQEAQALNYESLARYYAEMKPDKAVEIMRNLDDDVTIGILLNLEDEQVTSILSEMDPEKAASIVDQMMY